MVIATATDYFQDFKTLLVPFWLDKLKLSVMEAMLKGYGIYTYMYTYMYMSVCTATGWY